MSNSFQHRARKRFGQNFLHDHGVIQRIVTAIDPRPEQRLVEIGPGQGALTLPLLDRTGSLDVVELDRDLIAPLQQLAAGHGALRIHNVDALKFDFRSLAQETASLRVVGNLPYNISTPLLFHLIGQAEVIQDMHFMLQKEVVDRMAAPPGSGDYGRLSVMVQLQCEVERLFIVGPGAFRPAPKVDSAVVRLIPRRKPVVEVHDRAVFAALVNQAFSQRRKTLRNALKRMLPDDAIRAAGIDPGVRPEELDLAQFAALANLAAQLRTEGDGEPAA